ncbi:MAG: 50S ribosomal protein L11 methyltransferase [Rubrivivax sp.]|nr:50S ribosomal protein L11 methyltransferase [Rubrivivax sp.]
MFELVLRAPESLVENLSDMLVDELEALSVTVEDAEAGTADEAALYGEPGQPAPAAAWAHSTVRALFEDERAAEAAAALLLAQPWLHGDAGTPGAQVQALQRVPDEDWVRLTQSQFAPVQITPQFWVVPSWHVPPAAARTVIQLDPGLAFGTGTHPTTRLVLRWLAAQAEARRGDRADAGVGADEATPWPNVLDYGCGSGILAIAAAKLGAGEVLAVDIDPAAVEATAANAQRNGARVRAALPDAVPERGSVVQGGGHGGRGGAAAAHGGFTLVLANILAAPLKVLAPLLAAQVAPGGWLVLAGILERQAGELAAAYAAHLRIDVLDSDEGWVLMGGRAGTAD